MQVVSCLVSHILFNAWFACMHGVWCLFQGLHIGTLGNTLSGCVTQDTRVGPQRFVLSMYPTHPVDLVVHVHE